MLREISTRAKSAVRGCRQKFTHEKKDVDSSFKGLPTSLHRLILPKLLEVSQLSVDTKVNIGFTNLMSDTLQKVSRGYFFFSLFLTHPRVLSFFKPHVLENNLHRKCNKSKIRQTF